MIYKFDMIDSSCRVFSFDAAARGGPAHATSFEDSLVNIVYTLKLLWYQKN